MMGPSRPKYVEFSEKINMKYPHLKIGMKLRRFTQFREATNNYGIKHRVVVNFSPSNSKRCKVICKKGCPFYLWTSPMVKDKKTIQIKSGYLRHECARTTNTRHVNAKWITKNHLEQCRANPSWSIAGIIQAVKNNQDVGISQLKAQKARCFSRR